SLARGLPRAGARRSGFLGLLPAGDADPAHQPVADRVTARVACAEALERGSVARDPVGVRVGAEPLCRAGMVWARQRNSVVCPGFTSSARDAECDVSRLDVLPHG